MGEQPRRKHVKKKEVGAKSSNRKARCLKGVRAESTFPSLNGRRNSLEEKARILIVDDDELIRKSLTVIFRKQGYETETAGTGREAIEKAKERFFNLALLDIKLPDKQGIGLLRPLKKIHPDMMVIMVTAYASLETAVRALNEGASAYITKPLKKDELLATARECLEKQRLAGEKGQAEEALRESEEKFRTLVTDAPIGLSIIAKDGTYEYVNPKFTEIFGYTLKDVPTGKEWFERAYPDQAYRRETITCWMEDLKEAKAGETRPRIFTVICKDGSKKEIFFRPVSLTGGGQLVTYEDVTERKRAEEELQREKQAVQRLAEERETVAKIGRIISSTLEIDKVYELFAKEVRKLIPFDRIAINIIYPEKDTFSTAYIMGLEVPGRKSGDIVLLAGSFTGEAMSTRSSLLIQGEDLDEVLSGFPRLQPTRQAGFQSLMAVPLISKDRVIAVLHLRSLNPKAYTDADVKLAESIGSQIAGAIANAELYAEQKRADQQLKRQRDYLDALQQTSLGMINRLDLHELLEAIIERAASLIGVPNGYVYLLEPGETEIRMKVGVGIHRDHVGFRMKPGQGITGRVLETGQPMVVDDYRCWPDRVQDVRFDNLRSMIGIPLRCGDEVRGVIGLSTTEEIRFGDEEVEVMSRFAGLASIALDNAMLYTNVQAELVERKRAEEALARQAQELARSNAELEQFAYVSSHDLQEPLRKIQAFGDRIKAHYENVLDERGRDYLQRMQNAAKRLQTLINDLLTFSRVTTRAQPFAPVNLTEVAQDVVSDLEARIERTGGRVEVGELPTIEADPTQERQLLQNLIDNGLKFHRPEEAPIVKVHSKLLGEQCQIIVEDNGIGFDEKYLDRMFTIFQRLHSRFEYEGTGVGLAVCRKIAERHGGNITAQSIPGRGSTFIVTLPVKQPKGAREEMHHG